MRDWRIFVGYVDDLRTAAGQPAHGLCVPFPDDRRAKILIRTPTTAAEAALVPEAFLHELTHALISPLAGSNREAASIAVEEQIVWTLAPLLAELDGTPEGVSLARAMVRAMRSPRHAGSGRRQRTMAIDPMVLAALEAALEAEDCKTAIQSLLEKIKAAGSGEADQPSSPLPAMQEDPTMPKEQDDKSKEAAYARAARAAVLIEDEGLGATVRREVARALAPITSQLAKLAPDVDAVRREATIERAAGIFTDEEAAFLRTQPASVADGLLKAKLGGAPPRPERAARGAQPTRGRTQPVDAAAINVDRAMGIASDDAPAAVFDERTGRFSISNVKVLPLRVS